MAKILWLNLLCAAIILLPPSRAEIAENCANSLKTGSSRNSTGVASTSTPLVCYISWNGDETGLTPEKIELGLCTHIILGFTPVINRTVHLDPSLQNAIQRTVVLKDKDPDLKVLFSVGGGSKEDGFGAAVKSTDTRKILIDSILAVILEQKLDGVDFDWEFPAWHSDWREKANFAHFLRELRYQADETGVTTLVTVATAAPIPIIAVAYDITALAAYTDFVNLMTYDFNPFDAITFPFTGHNSPLFPRSVQKAYFATLNMAFAAEFWVREGYPRSKLLVGLPFYGHAYTLADPTLNGLDAPAVKYIGDYDFPTTVNFIRNGGIKKFDNESLVPYTYLDTTWITYDDELSLTQKASWLKSKHFGGAMIFSLNCDDWNKKIGNVTFPLLKTVHQILNSAQ